MADNTTFIDDEDIVEEVMMNDNDYFMNNDAAPKNCDNALILRSLPTPGVTEIVIDSDARSLLSCLIWTKRFRDSDLGQGTITLVISDPHLASIGQTDLKYENRELTAHFCNCHSLLRVDLSGCGNLTVLGKWCFDRCSNLQSFVFPESLKEVGEGSFNR